MHDAITLESRKIPCALICTGAFVHTAEVMADNMGLANYPFAVIDHPIGRLGPDRLAERVAQALPGVKKLLTETPLG